MSEILWIIGIIVLLVLVTIASIIVWIRTSNPQARKLAKEQSRLDERTGKARPQNINPVVEENRKYFKWFTNHFWSISFTLIGLAIFFGSMYSSSWDTPTLARVVSWSREHWLWVILLFGILAAIVQVNTVTLGKATEVLHKTLMGTVFMLFIGFPVWMWLTTSSGGSSVQPNTRIPLVSDPQSSWPKLTATARGRFSPIIVPPQMHVVMIGNNFRLHNVYLDGHECAFGERCVDGPLASVYATNEANETNIISYAFAPSSQ